MGGLSLAVDGVSIDGRVPDKAALAAVYLADVGVPVRRSRLAGLLWSDMDESKARANLRVTLSRFRTVAGTHIHADRDHLWLADDVDYDGSRVAAGDLETMLAGPPGDLLQGIDVDEASLFMDWVHARRQSLRTTTLLVLAEHLGVARRDHDWDRVTELAGRITDVEPWNEPAHRALIEAADARSGRAAAIRRYDRCVDALREHLGLEPEHDTTALIDQIRTGDSRRSDRAPTPSTATSVIPLQLTPFLGREVEVAQLAERLRDRSYRLLTLAGPGGVGKTRLASEVAAQLEAADPGGVIWASLASIETPEEFARHLADLLVTDAVLRVADPLTQLTAAIGDRSLCLVLDNFEHLVDNTGPLLLEMLRRCRDITLLVTSRRPLGAGAEDVFDLAGLPTPPTDADDLGSFASVRLFVERAYRVDKSFSLTPDNAAKVAELCRHVEGVPLHLELAAARVPRRTIAELIEHLDREGELPDAPPLDAPDRHKTFDAVFQQSWDLLDEDEQRALCRLSVTRGGFDHSTAKVLLGSDRSEPSRLTRSSLLVEERGGRFRFHELVRQSASSKLSPDDREDAERTHATWFLDRIVEAEPTLRSRKGRRVAGELLADVENIRQAWTVALNAGMTDVLGRAATGLSHLLELAGRGTESEVLLGAAAEACRSRDLDASDTHDEAFFLRVQAGQRATWAMDESTEHLCLQVEQLLADRPDRALDLAWSRLHHAQATYHLGDLPGAEALLSRSIELNGSAPDDPRLRGWQLLQHGRLISARGDFDHALEVFDEALGLFESVDDIRGIGQTLSYRGVTFADQNQIWRAYEADLQAFELCRDSGNRMILSGRHENLAASLLLLGDYEAAEHHTARALAMYRRNAEDDMESYVLAQHGECLLGLGDAENGEREMAQGIAMMRDERFSFGLLYNLPPWIRHLQRHGRHTQAILAAEELVDIALERDAEHYVLTGRAMLARSLAASGRHDPAAALAGETWDRLCSEDAPRIPWPVATRLDIAAAFAAIGDARQHAALDTARAGHLDTVRSIADPTLRDTFLTRHHTSIELASFMTS